MAKQNKKSADDDVVVNISTRHRKAIRDGLDKAHKKKALEKTGQYSFKQFIEEEYEKIIKAAGV